MVGDIFAMFPLAIGLGEINGTTGLPILSLKISLPHALNGQAKEENKIYDATLPKVDQPLTWPQ